MKKKLLKGITLILIYSMISGCSWNRKGTEPSDKTAKLSVMQEHWGNYDNKEVLLYTLKNKNGMTIKISNYGGIITLLLIPDKSGKTGDIVLGYDSLKDYLKTTPYFGAIVGRYANRIAKGSFTLDGKKYQLALNNGANALHGGIKGFDRVVWEGKASSDTNNAILLLTYLSKDGEEGYPGNLNIKVTYSLNDLDEFKTVIEASTDKATPVNLCNHTYFNLSSCKTSILDHLLMLNADRYTVVDDGLIPTGELRPVKGTPMDFMSPETIGKRIDQVPGAAPGGYDHNYVLFKKGNELSLAAKLEDTISGRVIEVLTTQPGIQFYSGNFLDGTIKGKNGIVYQKHWGLCLETQHFPDSPNRPSFPNTILKPGEQYREETIWKIKVKTGN